MSLKAVRRSTGNNALDWMVATAKMAADVTSMLQFPPTAAAASIVLTILKTIADIKINQLECFRLARRTARLLTDLGRRMKGKWEDAPESLLENIRDFEITLLSIQDFMLKASQTKWISRFVGKTGIEDSLMHYEQLLEDAAMSFQVSSLIEIHYALGAIKGTTSNNVAEVTGDEFVTSPISDSLEALPPPTSRSMSTLVSEDAGSWDRPRDSTDSTTSSFLLVECDAVNVVQEEPETPRPTEEDEFLATLSEEADEFGFRRYHQSDVIVRKANRKAVGWFSGTSEAQVAGQKMTVKRYDGVKNLALKQWIRDIKTLRNLHHENLPQILGYSDGKAPTPFILLASVQSRDLGAAMRSALTTRGLADCAGLILRTYRDIASAITHAQQQMSLTESQAQDFIDHATYSIDSDSNVIVGLPPPRDGWLTARSYGLEESLAERALQYLKELMNSEEAVLQAGTSLNPATLNKYKQLKGLIRSLLPQRREGPALTPELEELLDDSDEDNPLTLRTLRTFSIEQSRHSQTWNSRAPIGTLAPGDYGYIPNGSTDFAAFMRLGNIQDEQASRAALVGETRGTLHMRAGGFSDRQPATPFLLPDARECWPIALSLRGCVVLFVHREAALDSVNDAWRTLIARGTALAAVHGVKPQDLILITRSLHIEDHEVNDWSPPPPPMPMFGRAAASGFGARAGIGGFSSHAPGFGAHPHMHMQGMQAQMQIPSIVYLVTSAAPDANAYVTDDPMGRPRLRETRSTSWCFSCRSGFPVGYVDYIQLDAEDVQT
ncbi:hypothetical protein BC834DRAFT_967197 [Gloeopeniophorella convolvens]|nr:hypothetical protein BC834DRAFT_967197 [Gloeopeniophorella convolvens]